MQKVLLVVLDGWGHSDFTGVPSPENAVEQAEVPRFRAMLGAHPHTRLACSGSDVGLPDGLMGNSEVGHLNLGAGRIVFQDIARIDRAIADGSFGDALGLPGLVQRLRERHGTLHLVGLVSDGGVHSHIRHFEAVFDRLPRDLPVRVHCITDGRDTSPRGGAHYLERIQMRCTPAPGWRVATVVGRYWAMDRDRRWDRTRKAWRAIALGEAPDLADDVGFVADRYRAGETDEFLEPTIMAGEEGRGIGPNDAVILLNFRADRMRQIGAALTDPAFDGFDREGAELAEAVTMTEVLPDLPVRVAFPARDLADGLGTVVARAGLGQLRVAETEKYAHVTYFFNGGDETPCPGEERVLIPSPKVPTYDLQPEMSAAGVCEAVLEGLRADEVSFILVNFANPDMVGHTGVIPAAVKAVETVDGCLGRILDAVQASEGRWVALVTADHGNCERMLTASGEPHTAHTTEPVDFTIVDSARRTEGVRDGGRLADVAPTVLEYLGLEQPEAMTGDSLARRR
ncbi:2,3-bisphosphoglycerate-independent phosphoglycerate mutase [Gaopeijia maritima]|uniref:2,3-bisphosphoglycerate-independent phosphoglycerate mutase n=1 Tax=Gaopeijia maritima TaxID=3119007 RepID=UPI0032855958